MTAPLDPKNDWVPKDTLGHVETDWRFKNTDANLVADNIIWLKENPGSGGSGGPTNLAASRTSTQVVVTSSTGAPAVLAAADASNAGVITAAQQVKLTGIEPLADVTDTANVAAAGATMASTLTETVQDLVAAMLVPGPGVSLAYNDVSGLLQIVITAPGISLGAALPAALPAALL